MQQRNPLSLSFLIFDFRLIRRIGELVNYTMLLHLSQCTVQAMN